MGDQAISIFRYMDYREFLRDWREAAKKRRTAFSLRSFARRAGFQSHNFLKLTMLGKRNLSPQSSRKFAQAMKLDRREAEYFETLVAHNQESEATQRMKLTERLLQLQEINQIKKLGDDQFHYYKDWYHTAVRELVSSPEFREDPRWIANRLSPPITPDQAQESLELLLRLGLIRRARAGHLGQTDKLLTTGPEVSSALVTDYHRTLLELAKTAIDRFPRESRDISALTLGVSQKMLPLLKRRIQLFREEMMKLIATDTSTDTVVQFNCQLFPLTGPAGKEKRRA